MKPLKPTKVNIGMDENMKFATIGDYWDKELVAQIVDLPREYQHLFPNNFSKMKEIERELGEIKIPLKPNMKTAKHILEILNPKYKEKVKEEIEKMLLARIIEIVDESVWIILMVIQDNKMRVIRLFVDLRKLNDAFIVDLFPMPFTDEVLESVVG